MATYHTHEGTYELPAGWRDETVVIHSVGDPAGPARFSFVLQRAQPAPGEDFIDFAERQLTELSSAIPGVEVLGRVQREVDGALALEVELRWASDRGPMHQKQVYLQTPTGALIFTVSALGRIPEQHLRETDSLLASFRFRTGG
ncbi:MAG: DcrB-related protein [Polyangiaceae bacterium]